jgi:small GTP-binding protein
MTSTPIYKIIVAGSSGTGKTALINFYKFSKNVNIMPTTPTIGVDWHIETIKICDETIDLHIWDTAGQEKFDSVTTSFYRNAIGAVICFSLISYDSLRDLKKYINTVRQINGTNTQIVIVGTFLDKVTTDIDSAVYDLIQEYQIKSYIKISNLTGENIDLVFSNLTNNIFHLLKKKEIVLDEKSVKITKVVSGSKIKSYCC